MKKFLVTHKKNGKTLLFTYNLNGFLVAFKTDLNINDATVNYFNTTFPFKIAQLDHFKTSEMFRVEEIQQELSFKVFWDTYAYKNGNKNRAEKLWNALPEIEKSKAMNYIRKYHNFLLLNPSKDTLYPETYLFQKRYDNE